MTISFSDAIGFDLNSKKRLKDDVWHKRPHIRPKRGCPTNRLQPDSKLPVKRTLKTEGIFQVSESRPDQSFISNGWASVTPRDKCTVFVFEIDAKQAFGKTCNLVFDLPLSGDVPGLYRIVGPGQLTYTSFSPIAPPPKVGVTWNTLPAKDSTPPLIIKELIPGSSYIIDSTPCYFPLGITDKITRSGMLCSQRTNFQFKQSDMRCPLGLYTITTDPFKDQ